MISHMRHRPFLLAVAPLALGYACGPGTVGNAPHSTQPESTPNVVKVEVVAKGLEHPWGLDFLPDGRMIVTQRGGPINIVTKDGRVSRPLVGAPEVQTGGQGGMLDVAVDPDFAKNHRIFISYAEPGVNSEAGLAGTAVASATLTDSTLEHLRVIYQRKPKVRSSAHFGSRIVFRGDGTLFITNGEGFSYREKSQDLMSDMGKVVRINIDGTIPNDNPFVGRSDARPEIWSYGHRNPQGAAMDPTTGRFWTIEHGARGGDELNHPEPGKNYGWPVITYGRDYNGSRIGVGQTKDGMEQPVFYWDPVIAPSGFAIYTGDKFPEWKGNFFVGSMTPGALVRLEMSNGEVVKETRYLGELHERIRDVVQGPDGYLYLLTDSGMGRILRVVKANQ
jgi:glucose/arabinose dehydrogenase